MLQILIVQRNHHTKFELTICLTKEIIHIFYSWLPRFNADCAITGIKAIAATSKRSVPSPVQVAVES